MNKTTTKSFESTDARIIIEELYNLISYTHIPKENIIYLLVKPISGSPPQQLYRAEITYKEK